MGEMSSVSLGVESETEHVAEWIVLARTPCVETGEFKMDRYKTKDTWLSEPCDGRL